MDAENPVLDSSATWALLEVQVSRIAEEAVSTILFELGTTGIVTLSENDDTVKLGAYFDRGTQPPEIARALEGEMSRIGRASELRAIESSCVLDQDWMQKWKEGFEATKVGRRLIVAPSCMLHELQYTIGVGGDTPPLVTGTGNCIPVGPGGRVVVQIDPGMAFGTGNHETTRLCLELLERYWKGGRLLDVGTGTGILSIAAALLVPTSSITAIDIDPVAVQIARENVEINNVQAVVTVAQSEPASVASGDFDLVVANLTAESIIALMSDIAGCIRPGGTLILSGILCDFVRDVEQAVSGCGLALTERCQSGEWAALVAFNPDRAGS
jgi:ribosomal protein L11 methyltransferase